MSKLYSDRECICARENCTNRDYNHLISERLHQINNYVNTIHNAIEERKYRREIKVAKLFLCELLSSYHDSEIKISQVSSRLFVSERNIYYICKKVFQLSPKKVMNEIRLRRAKEIIKEQGGALSEVASSCGFNTQSYFCTCFKSVYGVTPSRVSIL